MADMTRSHTDWVHDWLLNPAIEHIGLTLPMLIEELGSEFQILGTSPEFITDWRWFKSLHGDARRFNDHALSAYQFHEKEFSNYLDGDSAPGIAEAEELLCRESFSADDVRNMGSFKSLFGRETIYLSLQRTV